MPSKAFVCMSDGPAVKGPVYACKACQQGLALYLTSLLHTDLHTELVKTRMRICSTLS